MPRPYEGPTRCIDEVFEPVGPCASKIVGRQRCSLFMMVSMSLMSYWPLAGLRVRTPRLELRMPSMEDLGALAGLAA